jgi:predicted MFS family arabinose efflux permease
MSARLLVDTGIQIFNPFLSIIAAGLGVNLVTMGRLLGLQNLTGLLSPFLGALAERHGYRRVMQASLVSGGLGFLLVGLSQHISSAMAGLLLIGLCIAGFIPTLIAYLSAHLPYHRRARGLGILEYSWALSGIIGLYLVGQLIAAADWRTPFFALAVGLVAMSIVFGALPPAHRDAIRAPSLPLAHTGHSWPQQLRTFLDFGVNARSAYSAMLAGTLNFFAIVQLNITYGAWLSEDYHTDAAQLGVAALVLGCFDLCASVSVSLFTDRLGKHRSVLLGAAGSITAFLFLPAFNTSLISAVLALAIARSFCEFFLVSNISLLSEQAPAERARIMTLNVAVMQIGFASAAFAGPWLFTQYGITGQSLVSAAAIAIAAVVMLVWVRESRQ